MLPSRCRERRLLVEETAQLYGVSSDTLYRALRNSSRPRSIHRSDSGTPRKLSLCEMELYCEVIAALKIRTCNKKGRHVSTARAIELLEEYGMDTPQGFIKPPKGLLTKATVNRYLKAWGYDHLTMTRQPPAVRFQAQHSNECWHFDLQFLVDKYKVPEPNLTPFSDPDPFQEFTYPTVLLAKRAIAEYLGQPLAKLSTEQRTFIDALLVETLNKKAVMERVRQYFQFQERGEQHAH